MTKAGQKAPEIPDTYNPQPGDRFKSTTGRIGTHVKTIAVGCPSEKRHLFQTEQGSQFPLFGSELVRYWTPIENEEKTMKIYYVADRFDFTVRTFTSDDVQVLLDGELLARSDQERLYNHVKFVDNSDMFGLRKFFESEFKAYEFLMNEYDRKLPELQEKAQKAAKRLADAEALAERWAHLQETMVGV